MKIKREVRKNVIIGLKNGGNTCYMNSILQCIFLTPDLSDYFLNGQYQKERKKSQILASNYNALLSAIQTAQTGRDIAVPT